MPSKDKDQTSTSYDQSADIQALREEVYKLQQVVLNVAEANAIENVIMNGFTTLAMQLQPLRELAPRRKELDGFGNQLLGGVRTALARPKWRGASFDIDKGDESAEHNQSRSIAS